MNTDAIATELLEALDRDALLAPITAREPGFGADAAYAVSAEDLRRRRARGERPIGRKIGFTNRTIRPEYGVSTPIWAPVYDRTVTFLDGTAGSVAIGLLPDHLAPEVAADVAAVQRLAVARRMERVDRLVLVLRHFRLLAVAHGASERGSPPASGSLTAEDRAALGLPPLAISLVPLARFPDAPDPGPLTGGPDEG